jgi:hypothetical protein
MDRPCLVGPGTPVLHASHAPSQLSGVLPRLGGATT